MSHDHAPDTPHQPAQPSVHNSTTRKVTRASSNKRLIVQLPTRSMCCVHEQDTLSTLSPPTTPISNKIQTRVPLKRLPVPQLVPLRRKSTQTGTHSQSMFHPSLYRTEPCDTCVCVCANRTYGKYAVRLHTSLMSRNVTHTDLTITDSNVPPTWYHWTTTNHSHNQCTPTSQQSQTPMYPPPGTTGQ